MRLGKFYKVSNWRVILFVTTVLFTSFVGPIISAPIAQDFAVNAVNDPAASRSMVAWEQSRGLVYWGAIGMNLATGAIFIGGIRKIPASS